MLRKRVAPRTLAEIAAESNGSFGVELSRYINPAGTLPALTDGDRVIYESLAICEYLAALHGSDLVVAPGEPRSRSAIAAAPPPLASAVAAGD